MPTPFPPFRSTLTGQPPPPSERPPWLFMATRRAEPGRSIVAAGRRARREDAELILLRPRGQVRRVLDLVGAPAGVSVLDRSDLLRQVRSAAA